ncbi:glucuronate isomerase [Testudinibacter sp. TR-2022]|uniref:glucuronate isomerase n=1 Tax=Testudinibacter sp. TR-2022 TaxID=2585029 RepID=UPI00111829B2|nr:glucuronate isomerase [Testudinibacter sp. TR-2022]TNH08478.1 glucuronate isomerase [Pasteurellaceae bacterium Phil11]TNH26048.1 glucuronate isomerase [Testudinibacter sp. TR-2022]TNH28297.1 glucuronate isomerase [Testudinibacter sp. TR-2022]
MNPFMCEDFLLSNETARRLYHDYAAQQPIFDYHCHLNPQEIAENRQFKDLSEIWLEGDHYKWRALRTAGVEERLITGGASNYEKYLAWANTVPLCIGNPIYHWTHLELRRPFGITNTLFNPQNAERIWHQCNEMLQDRRFSARGIMQQMNVKLVGTTDDPIDSLQYHQAIADDASFEIDVVPSFRPDKAFKIELPHFNDYLAELGAVSDIDIVTFADLQQALLSRLDHFDRHGCKSADHGIEILRFAPIPVEKELDRILQLRRNNQPLSELQIAQFSTAVLVWLGQQYQQRQWVMQLHIGALRNNNSRMFKLLGADAGFDSIADRTFAEPLSRLLDCMDQSENLPKTIIYCLNPRDNEMIASMIGNFQGGGVGGKIQFGSGWWFNDQKDGMERQLQQLSQLGLLSQFVGMLTDSRSFLSYTRHEYFRRILCEMLGQWVEKGEAPNDLDLLGNMVSNICFHNAKNYFK